jgi:glycine oxidase
LIDATNIAIVGAGLIGRLLAVELSKQPINVTLYEQDNLTNLDDQFASAAAFTAAGMIAPISETIDSDIDTFHLGATSIKLWPSIVEHLKTQHQQHVEFQTNGSLIIAHPQDQAELDFFKLNTERLSRHCDAQYQSVDSTQIHALEPDLANTFKQGLFLADEAQIDNRQLMTSLLIACRQQNVSIIDNTAVQTCNNSIISKSTKQEYDLVFDCRGYGAKQQIMNLRGVRGEVLRVTCDEFSLSRPVRLMHPRYQLYLAPKPNNHFVIGATQIESEDQSPFSLQSMMELCSALYSISPAFAEARIIEQNTNLRPALANNKPCINVSDKCISINGLFRHGYLIAPAIIQSVMHWLKGEECQHFNHLFTFTEPSHV